MNVLPLAVSVEGDVLISFVPMPAENTIDQAAEFAAQFALRRRVPEQPGRTLRLRRIDAAEPLARDLTLVQAGVGHMDWLHLYYE